MRVGPGVDDPDVSKRRGLIHVSRDGDLIPAGQESAGFKGDGVLTPEQQRKLFGVE